MSWKTYLLATGCVVASIAYPVTGSAVGPKPQTELEQIFYDMGVIGYCGLSTRVVSEGFNRQLAELMARNDISESHLRDARNRALTMVEWEWDNRGLGGFRGWCRSEGESAVQRFSD